jgi:hypothetical protein
MNRRTLLIGIAILSSAITVLPKLGFAQSVNVINPLARGVKCDGKSDDALAIQEIIDAIPVTDPAGGDILFPPAVVCAIGSPINVNGKNALRIVGTGGDTDSSGSGSKGGTQFKWIGGNNEVMFKFFGVRRTTFSGFTLEANGRANITGILWDGDNHPPSSFNEFRNLAVYDAHIGMQIGTAATGCGPGTGCQLDNTTIDTLRVFGNTLDMTGEGLLINSGNALQASTINKFVGQNLNRGIDIQSAGGLFTISNAAFGGTPLGTNPTAIFIATYAATPNIFQFEDEGPWAYSIHDSSGVSGIYPVLWYGNQFNHSVLIDGAANPITSIANASSNPSASFVVGNTAKVVSVGDTINWISTGNGTFLQVGANYPKGGVLGFEFTIGGEAGTGSLVFNAVRGGAGIFAVDSVNKAVTLFSTTNAGLGNAPNGSLVYCADCMVTNPCSSGGSGAIAKRLGGIWVCN